MRGLMLAVLGAVSTLCCAPAPKPLPKQTFELPTSYGAKNGGKSTTPPLWNEYFRDEALQQLVAQALDHNLDLRIALQRIEVARAGVHQATGARLPRVGVAAGVGVSKFGLYTMDGAGNASTEITPGQASPEHLPDFSVGLVSSWELDLWGRLGKLRESAVARYLATVEGANLVITSLISDTANAYFELSAVDRSLGVLEHTLNRQAQALDVMRVQKQAGRVTELAVQQFASQLADTRALQAELRQRATELEGQLSVLAGRLPARVTRTPTTLDEPNVVLAPGVPSDLLIHRPDVREAELALRAAECDVEAARAAFYPSVNITAGVGLNAFDPRYLLTVPESVNYGVSAGLLAPLVNKSAIEAEFDAASALQVQALYDYQNVILKAFAEVSVSLAGIERTGELVTHRRSQRDALAQTVDTAALLFNAGKASYLEVLSAEQQTLAAELELIDSLYTQRATAILLYKALGGGWR